MKDYAEKSDMEINKAVEKLQGMYCEDVNGKYIPTCDYCNDVSVAWPIIFENRITVNPYDNPSEGWFSTYDTSFFIDDENPLRAAMIVYLMMKDSEQ